MCNLRIFSTLLGKHLGKEVPLSSIKDVLDQFQLVLVTFHELILTLNEFIDR